MVDGGSIWLARTAQPRASLAAQESLDEKERVIREMSTQHRAQLSQLGDSGQCLRVVLRPVTHPWRQTPLKTLQLH